MRKKENYVGEMADYIKKNLDKGYTRESLKWALIQQGYSKLEVEKAMQKIDQEAAVKTTVPQEKPAIQYESAPVPEEKQSFWKRLFG